MSEIALYRSGCLLIIGVIEPSHVPFEDYAVCEVVQEFYREIFEIRAIKYRYFSVKGLFNPVNVDFHRISCGEYVYVAPCYIFAE